MINVIYRDGMENLLSMKMYIEIEEKEKHIAPLRGIMGIFCTFPSGMFSLF